MRGRLQQLSDAAIQTCLTLKVLFGMPVRQTTGVVQSLLQLVGLDWTVPDFNTFCRRQKTLNVRLPYRGSSGPLNLLIDSTGIKGEWNARKQGGPKRRIWRKIRIGIDEETLDARAVEVTTSNVGDAPMLPEFLDQFPASKASDQTLPLEPMTTENATTRLPRVAQMLSSPRARTPGRANPRAQGPSLEPR